MAASYLFLTERVRAFAGYWSAPATYDPLDFYLPEFSVLSHRVVLLRDRLWELWSPNAKEHAYYPGIQAPGAKQGTDLPSHLRRSDGHLGRFDYTVSPQHFDPSRPWLGFIRKWSKDGRPENAMFASVWIPSRMLTRGTFNTSFVKAIRSRILRLIRAMEGHHKIVELRRDLWVDRPLHLTTNTADLMNREMTTDEGTDLLARIQRDMKELSAWNRMSDSILRDLSQFTSATKVHSADESLIGVWLNGCDERNGLWLLRNRVPCYIVHEWDNFEDRKQFENSTLNCVSMTTGTFLLQYEEEMRIREKPLTMSGQILSHSDPDASLKNFEWDKANESTRRSMSIPSTQGFDGLRYSNPRTPAASSSSTAVARTNIPEKSILPPPVAGSSGGGTWTHWMQDERDEGVYLRKRGANYDGSWGKHTYFDRRRRRVLHLDEILEAPANYHADRTIFGLPAPNWPYAETQNEVQYYEHPISEWCYKDRDPKEGDEGRVFVDEVGDSEDEVSLGGDSDEGHWLISPEEAMSGMVKFPAVPMIIDERRSACSDTPAETLPLTSPTVASNSTFFRASPPRLSSSDRHYSPRRHDRPLRGRSRSRSPHQYHSSRRQNSSNRDKHYYSNRHRSRSRSPRRRSRFRSRSPLRRRSRSPRHRSPSLHRRSRSRSPLHLRSRSRSLPPDTASSSLAASNVATSSQASVLVRAPTLLDRMTCLDPSSSLDPDHKDEIILPSSTIPRRVMDMFPAPTAPPVAILPNILVDGQSRFVILWNVPLVYCWDNILEWLDEVTVFCHNAVILQVYRTNERGFQVFWLAFNSEEKAAVFRGVVTERYTKNGHLAKIDFVSPNEFNSVAGRCSDKWIKKKGYLGPLNKSQPFPLESAEHLSVPSLAARLGVQPDPILAVPTKRGKRGGRSRKLQQPTDGGAL